jgi:hypothetical protein
MEKLSYEKYLTAVPILGTSAAVLFDVGYFWGAGAINYFTFFSLTEHITFAIEALPYAIFILVANFFWAAAAIRLVHGKRASLSPGMRYADLGASQREELIRKAGRNSMLSSIILLAGVALAAGYLWYDQAYRGMIFFLSVGTLTVIDLLAPREWFTSMTTSTLLLGGIGALLIGHFFGDQYVTINSNIAVITLKAAPPIQAKIIRAGERAILVADPLKRTILLIPFSDVSNVATSN